MRRPHQILRIVEMRNGNIEDWLSERTRNSRGDDARPNLAFWMMHSLKFIPLAIFLLSIPPMIVHRKVVVGL